MRENYMGNEKYFLIEKFDLEKISAEKVPFRYQIEEEYIIRKLLKFLNNKCEEDFNERKLRKLFKLNPYLTEEDYEIYELDGENYLFVDREYYMSYIAQGEDRLIYLTCESMINSERVTFRF